MLFYHSGSRRRKTPLPFVACTRKAALLCGHMWSAHASGVVEIEVKACMTGCYHQTYQKACTNTVRKRLFCVSVYVLQVLESPSAACAYGAHAERYRVGWLCSPNNSWSRPAVNLLV